LNYYDDLGVSKHASPEEIRDAYRTLVRLLHPDQQTDPALKRAAEGQMRRINAVYAVLADQEQRRRYDMGPAAVRETPQVTIVRAPIRVVRKSIEAGSLIWVGVAGLSLGAIFWLAMSGQPRPVRPPEATIPIRKQEVASEAPPAAVNRTVRPSQAALGTAYVPTPVTVAKPPELPPYEPPPSYSRPAPDPPRSVSMPDQTVPVSTVVPSPKPLAKPPVRGFGGFWSYLHDQDFRQAGKYPPQFIETSITEKNGQLHGRYKARYYISDRPISPNVNFEFEGEYNGTAAKLSWHGEGGSQGQVEMTLMSDDEMEVVWRATELGQTMGLASGRAILRRRPE
jgi:hypothetical protein